MKNRSSTPRPSFALALCGILLLSPSSQAENKKSLISDTESRFIQNAAIASHAATEFAELGVKKAENASVKALAETLVTDHRALSKDFKKLADAQSVELSKEITPEQTATLQKLERATGAEFDKEFLAAFADGHQSLISSYEKASKDPNDLELRVIVDKTIPVLKAHRAAAIALAAK